MTDDRDEIRDKLKRTLTQEFIELEDDFDDTRATREKIIGKLASTLDNLTIVSDAGQATDDTVKALGIINALSKELTNKENAKLRIVGAKLKNAEQEVSSAGAARERIQIILAATAAPALPDSMDLEEMERKMAEMASGIGDFETKLSPRDLSE